MYSLSHSLDLFLALTPHVQITFVAKVRNVAEQSTNITYVVEDGTGSLEVKQWIDADSNAMNGVAQNLVGQYVRILGQLKSFGNKRHIGAHSIRQVTDYNEVQYHLLEATLIHLQFSRGPLEQFAPAGNGAAATTTTSYEGGRGGDTVMGGTDNAAGGGSLDSLLSANVSLSARRVLETIKAQPESNEGVHLNIISQKSKLSLNEVSKAVDELLLAGVAFTTVDENHVSIMSF
jgi:replication factor A2